MLTNIWFSLVLTIAFKRILQKNILIKHKTIKRFWSTESIILNQVKFSNVWSNGPFREADHPLGALLTS